MAEYHTAYQALTSFDEEDTDDNDLPINDHDVMIHVAPESSKARWNHIENLDDFFNRVYHYHQRHGFLCMVLEEILQLVQFVFVVVFSTFLIECVNYDVLFANIAYNHTHKVTIPEAIYPVHQCFQRFDFFIIVCLVIASIFWVFRLIKVVYNIFKYLEIRSFYLSALKISTTDLPNMTWHEVQRCLLEVQKEQHLCIHKQELNELDINHRILRFKNYMIAMVNKSVLPLKFLIPLLGECTFLSTGLKYNLEFILFWGPWSPFANNWHLRDDFKQGHKRQVLADSLASKILWLGVCNFLLCPVIFLWQILYLFFRYAELIKKQPSALGARRWSNYARLYLRHFNEVDHAFIARLNRGYGPASYYMTIFTTPILVIIAKNVAFFAGSVLAVLALLTVIDEDVLSVEHILTTMTVAGLIVTVCSALIPDEHAVYSPERLMKNILAHIHYMPSHWNGNAHTYKVRDEFALLFQYKAVYLVEELLSPIITPFILCFCLRKKSLEIVDFFRNFTVEVVGVGDVCSFAQMDIRKHGNPQWVAETETPVSKYQQAEDGKTELSLMHFHLTNPEWKLPDNCSVFVNTIKEQAQKDVASLSVMQQENAAFSSLYSPMPSLGIGVGYGFSNMVTSNATQSTVTTPGPSHPVQLPARLRGALTSIDGPLYTSSMGSLQSSSDLLCSGLSTIASSRFIDEGTRELMSADMSFSALYMHEMRNRRTRTSENLEDIRTRVQWQRQDSHTPHNSPHTPSMPEIVERPVEEEKEIDTSALNEQHRITKSC
ncbi:autophagy-related protein 9A-like [Haliotis asinina]|uniref:autophagy-related protein 9A-like n=1 Tax=Haliotis asinina TaxID=109174 RepID=UPI003531BB40